MELHRRYLLTGIPDSFDFVGELVADMRNSGTRPSHIGGSYEEFVRFPQYSDYQYNGKIGFSVNERAEGRRWLIGIELQLSSLNPSTFDSGVTTTMQPGQARVAVTLQFNPTRIIAHAIQRGIDIESAGWRELLVSDDETYSALREVSWNNSDNVLPSMAFWESAAPFHAIRRAARCLAVVDEFIHYLLVSDRLASERPLEGEPRLSALGDWQIRSAEVYQEFRQADASDSVRRMVPALRQMASNLAEDSWQVDERSPAVSYTLSLTKIVSLGIYAKTADRIRMEVRYRKPVPFTGSRDIESRMLAIAQDASLRVNDAREAILSRLVELDRPVVLGEAVGALCELSNKLAQFFSTAPKRHQRVLEILLVRGAVEAGPNGIISTEEARHLVEQRILQTGRIANHSRLGNRYPLSSRYAPLVGLFKLAEHQPIVSGIERE